MTSPKAHRSLPFECTALLLQGGGALGAYQAGVYQAMEEAQLYPTWVAGISIGAINAAIIAGNAPEKRIETLRKFWESITAPYFWEPEGIKTPRLLEDGKMRGFINQMSATSTMMNGISNFFLPRILTPWFHKEGSLDATSYYDTAKLKTTLESFVDFDRLNSGELRFSVGAVNVKTGNFTYFDTTTHTIGPEHIMASGALPPAFPAVEIDGEYYWDGGLVTNTPLQWVLDTRPRQDTLAFQVDLWSADGEFPHNMAEVMTREKEIQYSSRTRANTDRFKNAQKFHYAFANLFDKLPEDLKNTEEVKMLQEVADRKVYNIVHLIYHARDYEGDSKDYEFSRLSMEEHWQAGYDNTRLTTGHKEILERPTNPEGVNTFDFSHEKIKTKDCREAAE